MADICAIALFSGPAGSTLGIHWAGITDTVGVEIDDSAVATARAAGFVVVQDDIRIVDPLHIRAMLPAGYRLLLQASPPCQSYSRAANGKGKEDVELLLVAIEDLSYAPTLDNFFQWQTVLLDICADIRSALTFEVLHWIIALRPDFVELEQVPGVLPIWEAIATFCEKLGYGTWTGHVHSEQFGVPQTRKRAWMQASYDDVVSPPRPTHSKYHSRTPDKIDKGILPWVSIADTLGWPTGLQMRSNYGTGGDPAKRGIRTGEQPAPTVTNKIDRNKILLCPTNLRPNAALRNPDQPAPTMAFGHDRPRWISVDDVEAFYESRVNNQSGTDFDYPEQAAQPASVIAGRPLSTFRGANANRFNGSTKSRNDGFKLTASEAGQLQSFPADYPWQAPGVWEQIGNAVPPLMQKALTKQHLGI